MNTYTITSTYTKVEIRKTFENFEADLRMIVLRTQKWTETHLDSVCHDIQLFAEYGMLKRVDITLLDENQKAIRVAKYTVNDNGSVTSGERPGSNNDWPNTASSVLKVITTNTEKWLELSEDARNVFLKDKGFKANWSSIKIDLDYPHLSKEEAQLYANKGYELKKENYK